MKTTMLILITLTGLSTAAQAQPPEFGQRNRIKYLAAEMAEAAHHAYQNAEYCADLRRSTRAIDALYELDRQARRFKRQVRRHSWRSYRAEQAYWRLVQTYRRAQRHVRRGHAAQVVLQDVRRMGRLLNRISYIYDDYGYYGNYGPTWRNDHYRGNDYDDGYYAKKPKARRVKPPRGSTPKY